MPIVPGPIDNRAYVTTGGYHTERIARQTSHESTLRRIQAVRAQALEHMRLAQQLAAQRRELMQSLLDDGLEVVPGVVEFEVAVPRLTPAFR
jgi:hypothetical protein